MMMPICRWYAPGPTFLPDIARPGRHCHSSCISAVASVPTSFRTSSERLHQERQRMWSSASSKVLVTSCGTKRNQTSKNMSGVRYFYRFVFFLSIDINSFKLIIWVQTLLFTSFPQHLWIWTFQKYPIESKFIWIQSVKSVQWFWWCFVFNHISSHIHTQLCNREFWSSFVALFYPGQNDHFCWSIMVQSPRLLAKNGLCLEVKHRLRIAICCILLRCAKAPIRLQVWKFEAYCRGGGHP